MNEGHMKETLKDDSNADQPAFFLSHHGVLKTHGDRLKMHVVLNGSVELRQGRPINDSLHTSLKLQMDIFDILLRFLFRYEAEVQADFD